MDDSNDRLIGALVADLRPVRPLRPPALRTLIWLMLVAAVAVAIAMFADVTAMWRRMTAIPDMWLAVLGSVATMATAAFAAFEPARSVPRLGPAAAAGAGIVGRSERSWLHARLCVAWHPCRRDRRDAGLPAVHYRSFDSVVGGTDRHAAARLFVGPPAHGSNGGPRFGRGGGHVAEFLPSFRRRAGRPRRPFGCGADRRRGSARGRQADRAKFFGAPVTVPAAGSN